MGRAVIRQRDQRWISLQQLAIQLDAKNATADSLRIFDCDVVPRRMVSESNFEMLPTLRDAGIDEERRAAQTKSEDPLETRPIHPSSRARVPRPAAAPYMRRLRIYVAAGDVGFYLVAMNAGARAGVIDWVQKRKQLTGLVSVTEHREGDHRPDGAMRILAAILP